MTRYMPQDVFDCGALTLAMAHFGGLETAPLLQQLVRDYRGSFKDGNLAEDWIEAMGLTVKMLPTLFPERQMTDQQKVQLCITLSGAARKFNRSGERKRKFFKGALFTGLKQAIPDKVQQYKRGILIYHMLLIAGTISAKECGDR